MPSVFMRYAASTVADRPRPFAQWTRTVRPSATQVVIQPTASVSTASSGTVTSGTKYCRWAIPCSAKNAASAARSARTSTTAVMPRCSISSKSRPYVGAPPSQSTDVICENHTWPMTRSYVNRMAG